MGSTSPEIIIGKWRRASIFSETQRQRGVDEIAQVSKQRSVVDSNTGFHCSLFEKEEDVGCMVIHNHATLNKLAVLYTGIEIINIVR